MAETNNVELEIRAKNLTQEAFNKVSEALKALEDSSKSTSQQSSSSFKAWFATITEGVAAGELLHDAIDKVLDVAKELPAYIVELGEKGSAVLGVEAAFDRLSGGVANAKGNLDALHQGTQGTVGDMTLLQQSNKLLSDGIKLSAADFKTLGAGAIQLAQQTGGSTTDAFNTLSDALATGRTRTLALMGIHVEADAALYHYAQTIGKSTDELTDQEKHAATAAAVMQQLRARTADAGDQQLTFAQKVEAAKSRLENIEDEIGKAIATSPALGAAMEVVDKALDAAFGKDNQKQVQNIAVLIADVGIAGAQAASFVAQGATDIINAYNHARAAVDGVLQSMAQGKADAIQGALQAAQALQQAQGPNAAVPTDQALQFDGLANVSNIKTAREAISALGIALAEAQGRARGFDADYNAAEADVTNANSALDAANAFLKQFVSALQTTSAGAKTAGEGMKTFGDGAAVVGDRMPSKEVQAFTKQAQDLATQFDNLYLRIGEQAALDKFGSKIDETAMQALALGVDIETLGPAFAEVDADVETSLIKMSSVLLSGKVHEGIASIQADLDKLDEGAPLKGLRDEATLIAGAADAQRQLTEQTLYGADARLAAINDEEKQKSEAATTGAHATSDFEKQQLQLQLDAIHAFYDHQRDLANGTAGTIEERMRAQGVATQSDLDLLAGRAKDDYAAMVADGNYSADALTAAWQRYVTAAVAAGHGLKLQFEEDLTHLGASVLSALASGGSIGQALSGGAVGLGGDISKHLLSGTVKDLAKDHPELSHALGELAGPLGGAAVNLGLTLGKKLFDAMFGTAGRDATTDFAKTFATFNMKTLSFNNDGFDQLHKQLQLLDAQGGTTGEDLWKALTQGVGRNNPQQAAAVIAQIQTALQNIPATMGQLASDAGFQTTVQLEATAQSAVKLWEYMRDSGEYTADAVAQAWQKAQDALVAAGDKGLAALNTAKDAAQKTLDDLDGQIKSLQQSVDAEAPEAVMGVIEAQQRAQLDALQKQRAAAQQNLDDVTSQIQDAATAAVAAAQDAAQQAGKLAAGAIQDALDSTDFHMTIKGTLEGVGGSLPAHGLGGYFDTPHAAIVGDRPEFITPVDHLDTLAAMLADRIARATGLAAGGSGVGDVYLDGYKVGKHLMKRQPEIAAHYGANTQ